MTRVRISRNFAFCK